jgi:hypothetical protein
VSNVVNDNKTILSLLYIINPFYVFEKPKGL